MANIDKKGYRKANCSSLGLQLVPSVFEFSTPRAGISYEKTMKFTNVSKNPLKLRFFSRIDSKLFRLRAPVEEVTLPCGLSLNISLSFNCHNETDEYKSCITVNVCGEPFTIPILVQLSKPSMDVARIIDFGKVIADGRVILSKLPVSNWGLKQGSCQIVYRGPPSIKVHEESVYISSNEIKEIPIELRAAGEGKLREKLEVKLDGRGWLNVQLLAEIVKPRLELLHPITKETKNCIKFGCVYYGSVAVEMLLLHNNSPEPTSFVCILDYSKVAKENTTEKQVLSSAMTKFTGEILDPDEMFSVIPTEGYLQPYESMKMYFKFNPRFVPSEKGWNCLEKYRQPPRKDFTVYMAIESVGASGTLVASDKKNGIEIGCIATALPVDVCFHPSRVIFDLKKAGQVTSKVVKMENMSETLPLQFVVQRASFIRTTPKDGILKPLEAVELNLSLKLHNYGKMHTYMPIDIFGFGCSETEPNRIFLKVIYTNHVECVGIVRDIEVTNHHKVGIGGTEAAFADTIVKPVAEPSMVVLKSDVTSKDYAKSTTEIGGKSKIAFSNERPESVRSFSRRGTYRTMFTRMKRYKYSEHESEAKRVKNGCESVRRTMKAREKRDKQQKMKRDEKKLLPQDLGMIPQAGLVPQELKLQGMKSSGKEDLPVVDGQRFPTKPQLLKERDSVLSQPIVGGLKPFPESTREKSDCKIKLTPAQLYMIVIGPGLIDFGRVCESSTNTAKLFLLNCLRTHILICFELLDGEVKFGCPLSMVVPPRSHTEIPVDFEPMQLENFYKSIKYSINQHHDRHVVVVANVVKPMLEFEPKRLMIEPYSTRNAFDGYHGVVTLSNPLNHPTRFDWRLADDGIEECAFQIHPKSGVVDAHSVLDCEVIYHLSKLGYDTAFILNVRDGVESKLECSVQLDPAKIVAVDENIAFGPLAFHLPVEKMCILRNVSMSHACFQVATTMHIPVPTLTPNKGVLSAMDLKELKLHLLPDVVGKLDQRLAIVIKNGKTVELKLSGQVEPPLVEMSQMTFNFRTVPCGSKKALPFSLTNKGKTKAEVEFDLRGYVDFSITFIRQKRLTASLINRETPGVYKTEILSGEAISVEFCFHPKKLAAYDFSLPLDINNISNFLASEKKFTLANMALSKKVEAPKYIGKSNLDYHTVKKNTTPFEISLPYYHVSAVATPQVLKINPQKAVVTSSQRVYGVVKTQNSVPVELTNMTDKPMSWALNIYQSVPVITENTFMFSWHSDAHVFEKHSMSGDLLPGETTKIYVWHFTRKQSSRIRREEEFYELQSTSSGKSNCVIPIAIKSFNHPAGFLEVEGVYQSPKVEFNPPEVVLPIVPLNITVHAQFYLNTQESDFTIANVRYPQLTYIGKSETDLDPSACIEVGFPNGHTVKPDPASNNQRFSLPMVLTFHSPRPIFFSDNLILTSSDGFHYSLLIGGGCDNCLLSTHSLLQQWRPLVQIVVPPVSSVDDDTHYEPMVVVCNIMNVGPSRSQSTDSTFDLTKSETSADTVTVSSSNVTESNSWGLLNSAQVAVPAEQTCGMSVSSDSVCDLHQADVVRNIVERWFTVNGFPGGIYPIRIPESMTRAIRYSQMQESRTLKLAPLSKLYSTIFDCIHAVTGRMILGNLRTTLSTDVVERAQQLYVQNDSLLRFLHAQAGCTVGMKAEYLLSYKDYSVWVRNKNNRKTLRVVKEIPELDRDTMKELSAKCWTEYLLQIYKTLILYRISMQTYPTFDIPQSNGDIETINISGLEPYSSNLYSISERIVLLWLNKVYEAQLPNLCKLTIGTKPTKRWIVNFDTDLMDSLVFAAVISAFCPLTAEIVLKKMYGNPTTPEQIQHNAIRIVLAMEELGKEFDIKPADIVNPHPVAMVMFCVFLFERFPSLLSKASIIFSGQLHSPVMKQITLTNPSTRVIGYKVCLSGPGKNNYSTTHAQFTIPPNGKFNLNIECKNRRMNPPRTDLQLQAKKLGPLPGLTLTFTLEAVSLTAAPVDTIFMESHCYEQKTKILRVRNFFNEAGVFRISLYECLFKEGESVYNPELCNESIRYFNCAVTSIALEQRTQEEVIVVFTPLMMVKRQCFILFSCESIGDFVYSVVGEVQLPLQMPYRGDVNLRTSGGLAEKYPTADGVINVYCFMNQEHTIELPIPFENEALERALVQASQTYLSTSEFNRRKTTETVQTESVLNMLSEMLFHHSQKLSAENEGSEGCHIDEKIFKVEVDCDQFIVPSTLRIVSLNPDKTCLSVRSPRCKAKRGIQDSSNILTIKITPKVHGYYLSQIILRSLRDVRVYQMKLCSNSVDPLALLEFSTAAHQAIAQDIPLVNNTKFDWNLDVAIEGRGFSGPPKLSVSSYSTQNYSLVFWPMKESTVEGSLKFANVDDKMEYRFSLLGRALHPFPFASYSLTCQARQIIRKEIEVPNITLKKFTFVVESDLVFLSGPPSLSVPPLCKGIYPLEIYCLTSGNFTGTLSFKVVPTTNSFTDSEDEELLMDDVVDKDEWMGYVVWASLEISATPAAAEKTVTIVCNLLESTTLETLIKNPVTEPMTLGVEIVGEGLSGAKELLLGPGQKETYRLTYTPVRTGSAEGRLIFCHMEVGEFWYFLKLQALPPLPTYLPEISCQLGKTMTETLVLKNCCREVVMVEATCTDTLNFVIGDGDLVITLPAHSETPVQYRFTPSGIQKFKNKFTFTSKQLGEIIYYITAVGLYPVEVIVINIKTPLGMTNSHTINFLNPTTLDATGKITFREPGRDKTESSFSIPLDQMEGIFMRSRTEFQIPIFFRARHMREYKATILVSLQRADKRLWLFLDQDKEQPKEVVWTYHVFGIPEYMIDRKQRIFKVQAKKVSTDTVNVHLHHCVPPTSNQGIQLGTERFNYNIQVQVRENLVKAFTKIILDKESWDCKSNVAELSFKFDFAPLMTMKSNATFTIRSNAGGIWKLPLSFIATEPDPDSILIIKALDNDLKNNSVEILLRSPTENQMPFHAYFLPKSDNDFKIIPESGILPNKMSAEPLKITVTYHPKNYVKVSKAKLMVHGDECEWLYDVQGYPPQYKPPTTYTISVPRTLSKTTIFQWSQR